MGPETPYGKLTLDVKFMDDDHKALLESVDKLIAVSSGDEGIDAINDAYVELVNHTVAHFEREERSMLENGFQEYEAHKAEHALLLDQISIFAERLAAAAGSALSSETVTQLTDWLIRHINGMDRAYARYLREVGGAG